MNPQMNSELPPVNPSEQYQLAGSQPSVEASQSATAAGEITASKALESASTASPVGQAAPVQAVSPSSYAPLPPVGQQPPVALPPAALPQIADDNDLIEKEWVLKAKEIVARTKQDPYQQNRQVELMKADYMRKRYNKEVRLTDD